MKLENVDKAVRKNMNRYCINDGYKQAHIRAHYVKEEEKPTHIHKQSVVWLQMWIYIAGDCTLRTGRWGTSCYSQHARLSHFVFSSWRLTICFWSELMSGSVFIPRIVACQQSLHINNPAVATATMCRHWFLSRCSHGKAFMFFHIRI